MKKLCFVFALFCAFFMASCGSSSKTVDTTDTGEGLNDEDTSDTDSPSDTDSESDTELGGDTEPSDDSDSDNPDTTPDGGDSQPDDGETEPDNDVDTADTVPDQDTNADTGSVESPTEGIYLGIIGFNYKLNPRPIEILTNTNMTEFQDFIDAFEMDDGTALYYADYKALDMMNKYTPVPPKLQTVALVTFTDGEDTSSDGEENDPEHYNDPDVYLNAIHNKIKNEGIHGLSVEAYSIGLRSGDTGSDFKSRLEKLASSSNNAFEVSNMEEVQDRFTKIAEDLYSVFKTINIDFKVLGNYSDGTRMRFSLDIYCDHDENECEKNGKNSNLYIDATYRRNGNERSFENFAYHGFSGSLTTVKCGDRDPKGFYPCSFENLQYDNMDTEIKQIELWKNDNSEWKHENEALKQEDSAVNESKSSALIMLVLDCTTSLGNTKFRKLQEAGKDFIETLVNGGSGVTTTPCDNDPCSGIANSTGVCTVSGTNYVCGCNGDYEWNGSQCVKPATPCDPNPCTSISNSNGNCTVSGTSYVCGCNSGYNWNGTQCLDTAAEECTTLSGSWNSSTRKCTRTASCSSKPANTVWNTVSSITQIYNYDNGTWEPSTTSSFNETGSINDCRYKCVSDYYEWNGSMCFDPVAEECTTLSESWNSSTRKCTRTENCSSKPANTIWNTVSSITQTYNYDNETWEPATTSSFNETGSTNDCRYKCVSDYYEWNGSMCFDPVAEECATLSGSWNSSTRKCTRTANCSSKPSNTVWNTVSSITQTYNYDNEAWEPATTSSFNETGSTNDCHYKCASGYTWNGSMCVVSCSSTSSTPCRDSSSGLTWSARSSSTMTWQNALNYCNSYSEGGLSGWHLPTISELRTLIINCSSTITGGSCGVTDSCLSSSCYTTSTCMPYSPAFTNDYCPYYSSGEYSKFREATYLYSSSTESNRTDYAWGVNFFYGSVDEFSKTDSQYYYVRCVR